MGNLYYDNSRNQMIYRGPDGRETVVGAGREPSITTFRFIFGRRVWWATMYYTTLITLMVCSAIGLVPPADWGLFSTAAIMAGVWVLPLVWDVVMELLTCCDASDFDPDRW